MPNVGPRPAMPPVALLVSCCSFVVPLAAVTRKKEKKEKRKSNPNPGGEDFGLPTVALDLRSVVGGAVVALGVVPEALTSWACQKKATKVRIGPEQMAPCLAAPTHDS